MLAHFIGGPWHGETRQECGKPLAIKGMRASLPKVTWWSSSSLSFYSPLADVEEFEYRRMSPDPQAGYVLYRYVESKPKVVKIELELTLTHSATVRAELCGFDSPEAYLNRVMLKAVSDSGCCSFGKITKLVD